MLRAYKYRILPNEAQKEQMKQIFGGVRFLYNLALETRILAYNHYGVRIGYFELNKQLTDLKKEATWLKSVPAQALQSALRNLDNAYDGFFRGEGFPKFKPKRGRQSFQLPQSVKVDFEGKRIFLPKLKWVDCVYSRQFSGEVKTVTVCGTTSGGYYVSVLVDTLNDKLEKKPILRETAVGVDLGIKDFAILSNGRVYKNHRFLKRALSRLRIEQRTMARRFKKGAEQQSNGYLKQKLVVAKLFEKITNQRNDFLHKTSTSIIKEFDTVCIETITTSGLMKNRKLSRAIGEMGWWSFSFMLKYKAEWYGKNVIQLGHFAPTSKTCNVCGWHNKELRLEHRTWTCENGHKLDRDLNAAKNILDFGLRSQPLPANVKQ